MLNKEENRLLKLLLESQVVIVRDQIDYAFDQEELTDLLTEVEVYLSILKKLN